MTLSNIEIPIGPKLMQVKVIKLDKKLTRTYVGQMDSYVQPSGNGRILADDAWIYEGTFKNGMPNGYGRYIDVN